MNDFRPNIALLPTGFSDLMPEQAEKEAYAIQTLMEKFTAYGYQRVKPPLLEFEESLLAPGPGAALAQDTFRVMDPASHRMMGLRSDITPQIARLVSSRFENAQKPLRVTYANDVLRTRAGQLRTARQFCQVGCEMIGGENNVQSYVELCVMALGGLKALDLKNITLDITIPRLIDDIVAQENLSGQDEYALREALHKRDYDGIANSPVTAKATLLELLGAVGDLSGAIEKVNARAFPETTKANFAILVDVQALLSQALRDLGLDDVRLTFDPFENKGFEYHNGLAFALFAENIRGELGRGGQYDISFGAENCAVDKAATQSGHNDITGPSAGKKAKGFTLYMDTILPAISVENGAKNLAVANDVRWDVLQDLQAQGWRIFRYEAADDIPKICTSIYKDGAISDL